MTAQKSRVKSDATIRGAIIWTTHPIHQELAGAG
jgi:hypothetical protein